MVQKGGYPFWYDDVPKGMSRSQYMKLSKTKPKNKSMKVWIKENKKNMKKYTKKIKKKSSGTKEGVRTWEEWRLLRRPARYVPVQSWAGIFPGENCSNLSSS